MNAMDDKLDLVTRQTILVVDDTPDNIILMSDLLKDRYKVKVANSGANALLIAQADTQPDLILLDIMMPDMDGYEVCRLLKSDARTRDISVIFLTAKSDPSDEKMGLELGAVDYLTKPISPSIALARIRNHLLLKASTDFLREKSKFLEQEVQNRTREVTAIQDVTILAMASLAETRDQETGNHIRRTQFYVKSLAEKLKDHHRFNTVLTEGYISVLFKSAPLHDIGKVGIPDRILLKPGRFEPHEFELMKTHAKLGRDVIEYAERALGIPAPFLSTAKEIVYGHHEKWDGSGYPLGLSGESIPLSARLMAVADVYDALISRRVYKEGMPHDQAMQIIIEGKGKHFDPDLIDALIAVKGEFQVIAARFYDTDHDMAEKQQQMDRLLGTSG